MSSSDTPFLEALTDVMSLLDMVPGPSMIIGGLAVITHGHIRTTDDIDATVLGARTPASAILTAASAVGVRARIADPEAFARRTQMLLLVHERTGVEVDLSLAWIPFEAEALERSQAVLFKGLALRVCSVEDLIIYKLVAARPLDLEDARQLALRHWRVLDRGRIRRLVQEFDEVLEDGRSRAEMWRQIERSAFPA